MPWHTSIRIGDRIFASKIFIVNNLVSPGLIFVSEPLIVNTIDGVPTKTSGLSSLEMTSLEIA